MKLQILLPRSRHRKRRHLSLSIVEGYRRAGRLAGDINFFSVVPWNISAHEQTPKEPIAQSNAPDAPSNFMSIFPRYRNNKRTHLTVFSPQLVVNASRGLYVACPSRYSSSNLFRNPRFLFKCHSRLIASSRESCRSAYSKNQTRPRVDRAPVPALCRAIRRSRLLVHPTYVRYPSGPQLPRT